MQHDRRPYVEIDYDERLDSQAVRCRSLWRAVIIQAVRDIMHWKSNGTDSRGYESRAEDSDIYTVEARVSASRWILEGDRRFQTVCGYADLDPLAVQRTVREFLDGPQV